MKEDEYRRCMSNGWFQENRRLLCSLIADFCNKIGTSETPRGEPGKPADAVKAVVRRISSGVLRRPTSGGIDGICLSGHHPAMEAWYHPSMAWMAPNRITWLPISNDEKS